MTPIDDHHPESDGVALPLDVPTVAHVETVTLQVNSEFISQPEHTVSVSSYQLTFTIDDQLRIE
jgi:hypothetical protein